MRIVRPLLADYKGQYKSLPFLTAMTMNCNYASGVRFLKIELPLILKGGRKKLAVQTDLLPKETPNPFGPVPFRAASFFLDAHSSPATTQNGPQLGNPVRFRRLSANSGFGG